MAGLPRVCGVAWRREQDLVVVRRAGSEAQLGSSNAAHLLHAFERIRTRYEHPPTSLGLLQLAWALSCFGRPPALLKMTF